MRTFGWLTLAVSGLGAPGYWLTDTLIGTSPGILGALTLWGLAPAAIVVLSGLCVAQAAVAARSRGFTTEYARMSLPYGIAAILVALPLLAVLAAAALLLTLLSIMTDTSPSTPRRRDPTF